MGAWNDTLAVEYSLNAVICSSEAGALLHRLRFDLRDEYHEGNNITGALHRDITACADTEDGERRLVAWGFREADGMWTNCMGR